MTTATKRRGFDPRVDSVEGRLLLDEMDELWEVVGLAAPPMPGEKVSSKYALRLTVLQGMPTDEQDAYDAGQWVRLPKLLLMSVVEPGG